MRVDRHSRSDNRYDDEGLSLVEISLAMAVMMMVLIAGMRAATTAVAIATQAVNRGQATTEVVGAINELRQEIISANVIFDPSTEVYTSGSNNGVNYAGKNADGTNIPVISNQGGWSLRIYTQLNGNPTCVQWRLLDTGSLQTRAWPPSWSEDGTGTVHPWSTLATNVVNGSTTPPFALNYGANYGGSNSRLVVVSLLASASDKHVTSQLFQSSIAARDAEYYPANTGDCFPVPTP